MFARFYHLRIVEIVSLYYSVHGEPMPGARNALDFNFTSRTIAPIQKQGNVDFTPLKVLPMPAAKNLMMLMMFQPL